MNKLLKQYPNIKKAQEKLDPEKLKEYTKEGLRTERIFTMLESLSRN